jgi:arylsulfatase A-like enzyme
MKTRLLPFKICLYLLICTFLNACSNNTNDTEIKKRPNVLFCIADDWGWPHATPYGDHIVQTPAFNRLVEEGVIFEHAYVSSPSCTPSRGAILTGQYHWRLKEGANLWSTLDVNIPVYPLLLEEAGYHVGRWRKTWGPGDLNAGGYIDKNPGGKNYPKGFEQFLEAKPTDKPFCFWLGASDPHRGYEKGSGAASGIDISKIQVPHFFPDHDEIRSDIADYYYEVQRFDSDVSKAISMLEEIGELDNTIIVMTGDHGMPFPRCKSNLYDMGVRVPLAIRWGKSIKGNRNINDFVSLTDLAPTFLDACGVSIPNEMSGKSLMPMLLSNREGWIEPNRDQVVFGKERHVPSQLAPSMKGYPSRAIRTQNYLYINNLEPDSWPAGVPDGATHPINSFADCDNGPTKSFLIEHAHESTYKQFYDWSFAKRPAEELFDVVKDPFQINNLADNPGFKKIKKQLYKKLMATLKDSKDPRVIGGGELFENYPYRAGYKLNGKK